MRSIKHGFLLFVLSSWIAIVPGFIQASHQTFMHLQSVQHDVNEVGRTGFHFQPPRNWINDPNGPMYYKGVYHLFYQYNPKGAVWNNTVWAHSVSIDLINWHRLPVAIAPSESFDYFGCWSGSATIDPYGRPIIFYTGIVDGNKTQVQNYAIPADLSDPYLQVWIKPKDNPIIKPDPAVNRTAFRDPTTAWLAPDGEWRLSLGGQWGDTGIAYLYRSQNLKKWTKVDHPLHSTTGTGNWECPDFYPVAIKGKEGLDTSMKGSHVKHVLKVSLDVTRYEYYTIGSYINDTYIPDKGMIDGWNGLRYDYGNFYASKSFYDPSRKRRILWGWANESDSKANDKAKGWAGIQLIPRTIRLDPNGKQLLQWPINEVEKLRGKKVELRNQTLLTKGKKVAITGITANQADVEVVFSFSSLDKAEPFNSSWDRYDTQKLCSKKDSTVQGGLGPFGLATLASKTLEEYTPVFFRVFKDYKKYLVLMCSDASRSSLKNGTSLYRPSFGGFVDIDLTSKRLSLRSLIDNSVVESFGAGGKTCISSRVYPTLAIYKNAHLYVFNNGSQAINVDSLTAWSMNRPHEMNQ